MKPSILAIIIIGAIFTSCVFGNSTAVKNAFLDEEFTLSYNQTASITSEKMLIRFTNVLQDSRCPTDIQCIQAGDAKIEVIVNLNDRDQSRIFESSSGRIQKIDGVYAISLQEVYPDARSDRTLKPQDYQITLKISKT